MKKFNDPDELDVHKEEHADLSSDDEETWKKSNKTSSHNKNETVENDIPEETDIDKQADEIIDDDDDGKCFEKSKVTENPQLDTNVIQISPYNDAAKKSTKKTLIDDYSVLQCIPCNQHFYSMCMLKYHTQKFCKYWCKSCDIYFRIKSALFVHVAEQHNYPKFFKCIGCEQFYNEFDFLQEHLQNAHLLSIIKPAQYLKIFFEKFFCDICPKSSDSLLELEQHKITHSSNASQEENNDLVVVENQESTITISDDEHDDIFTETSADKDQSNSSNFDHFYPKPSLYQDYNTSQNVYSSHKEKHFDEVVDQTGAENSSRICRILRKPFKTQLKQHTKQDSNNQEVQLINPANQQDCIDSNNLNQIAPTQEETVTTSESKRPNYKTLFPNQNFQDVFEKAILFTTNNSPVFTSSGSEIVQNPSTTCPKISVRTDLLAETITSTPAEDADIQSTSSNIIPAVDNAPSSSTGIQKIENKPNFTFNLYADPKRKRKNVQSVLKVRPDAGGYDRTLLTQQTITINPLNTIKNYSKKVSVNPLVFTPSQLKPATFNNRLIVPSTSKNIHLSNIANIQNVIIPNSSSNIVYILNPPLPAPPPLTRNIPTPPRKRKVYRVESKVPDNSPLLTSELLVGQNVVISSESVPFLPPPTSENSIEPSPLPVIVSTQSLSTEQSTNPQLTSESTVVNIEDFTVDNQNIEDSDPLDVSVEEIASDSMATLTPLRGKSRTERKRGLKIKEVKIN